jgi:hypothetical protein
MQCGRQIRLRRSGPHISGPGRDDQILSEIAVFALKPSDLQFRVEDDANGLPVEAAVQEFDDAVGWPLHAPVVIGEAWVRR